VPAAPPLLIAGGGIGGLTLAALLRKRGRSCLVLERAKRFEPVGAGIVLQPNAIKALRMGGIEDEIARRGSRTRILEIRDARGRILSSMDAAVMEARFGAGVVGFHRATLHAALVDLVEPSSLRLGAALRSFGESASGVFVELETGERIEGAALVGADGLRSAVRLQRLGDGEPVYSGYTSWRGVTARGSHWPSGSMNESWGEGARFGLVAIDEDRLYWFATANTPVGGKDHDKAALLARYGSWHDPIRAVIEGTPETAILRTDISDRDPVASWSKGRVTLLGDAAHPMTPNLGQGGGQAIEDAVILDRCLASTTDIAAAFIDYESRRFARTARVVREARRFGRLGQLENPLGRSLRDLALRLTPLGVTLRSLDWLYSFEA
jgi:2-polyprenyl-6-methoxyphenol hydroxylase-like FAD-dependent oxidoreductase